MHGFPISYSYTEWYLLFFVIRDDLLSRRVACQKLTIIIIIAGKQYFIFHLTGILFAMSSIIISVCFFTYVDCIRNITVTSCILHSFYWGRNLCCTDACPAFPVVP